MNSIQRKALFLCDLSESTKSQFGKVDFEKQPMPQKVFSALWTLISEVDNGGYWQYFANSSAETAYFIVEALQIIGAHKTAEVTQRAINVAFPDGLPEDYEDIRAVANAHVEEKYRKLLQVREASRQFSADVMQQLNDLDNSFYQCPDELDELLFAFVQCHPEEFGSIPEIN